MLKKSNRSNFIGLRKDQLGARLLVFLNIMRLAEDYNADFCINWFPTNAAAPRLNTPSDLFSKKFIDRHFIDNDSFEKLSHNIKPIWTFQKDKTPDRLKNYIKNGGNILVDEGFEILCFPWENSDELAQRFRDFIFRFEFNPVVEKKIQMIIAYMNQSHFKVSAFHIRRGDILNESPWKHKEWPAKIEPDELYTAYFRKKSDTNVLIFSDQPESIVRFTKENPQVKTMDDIIDLSDCKPIQRDFLELFTMSRALEIIAPPISAFSRAAARLSGRERKCFHDIMSVEERNAAYNDVVKRFQKGIDQFITPSEAAHIYVKTSRRLQELNREAEAWDIGQNILDSGADNAFLPLMHATNGVYLKKWNSALQYIRQALKDSNQWQENYISALAIQALILSKLNQPILSDKSYLQAFWQKPMLPDVVVVGTALIRWKHLRFDNAFPFDRDTLINLPIKFQFTNIVLQQKKIMHRRALDLSTIAIEWPWFAMDNKTVRLLDSKSDLQLLKTRLLENEMASVRPVSLSFCALLEARMGQLDRALENNTNAMQQEMKNPLIHKRQAEIFMMRGDYDKALREIKIAKDNAPEHAFWDFLIGTIYMKSGEISKACAAIVKAVDLDDTTAELHSKYANLCYKIGDRTKAIDAFKRAIEIAPNQKRYKHRQQRIMNKK